MDPLTMGFLIVGCIGAGLLLLSLIIGDIAHLGGPSADGPISLPAVGACIGGGGFVGMIPASLLPVGSARVLISVAIALIAAFPLAWVAIRTTRAVMNMHTDQTPTDASVYGALGTVVTPIPSGGYGEVRIRIHGTDVKYSARSPRALAVGTPIYVTDSLSATSVEVVSTADEQ